MDGNLEGPKHELLSVAEELCPEETQIRLNMFHQGQHN